jgi:hypothetical protein
MAIPSDLVKIDGPIWLPASALASVGIVAVPRTASPTDLRVLPEAHPMWDVASGGSREMDGAMWDDPPRLHSASVLAAGIRRMLAGDFFDLIRSEPGRLFSVAEILDRCPGIYTNARALAGSMNGFRRFTEPEGLVYPFHWWKGRNENSTLYAIRPSVAAVFAAAEKR